MINKMKKCPYSIELPKNGICCNVYSNSNRPDGKFWAHWPKCSEKNCPLINPDLLEEATVNYVKLEKSKI